MNHHRLVDYLSPRLPLIWLLPLVRLQKYTDTDKMVEIEQNLRKVDRLVNTGFFILLAEQEVIRRKGYLHSEEDLEEVPEAFWIDRLNMPASSVSCGCSWTGCCC